MMVRRMVRRCERGMCTAEYAVGTVAACGFACILIQLLPNWRALLMEVLLRGVKLRFGWPDLGFLP